MSSCSNCYRELTEANTPYHNRGDCILVPNDTTVRSLRKRISELQEKNDKVHKDIDAAHELIAKLVDIGNLSVEEEDLIDAYFESLDK